MNLPPAESRRSAGRRTSDTLLRRALELAHLGWWQLDLGNRENLDANPLRWSDEVYRIFGHEPNAFPASNEAFFAQVHPDDIHAIRAAVEKAIAEGGEYHIEHRIVRPDGDERIVEEHASVELDGAGNLLRMVGTVLDVTDRRRIEAAIGGGAGSVTLLSQVVEHSHDAIISAALDGVITTWNPAATRIFGWKADEIIGRSAEVFTPAERMYELAECLELARKGQRKATYETVRRRRDGSAVDVEISASPIFDVSSAIIGISAIIRDVTEQKRMAAQLQHAQRLESIGRLAGGVAHDFNNLLMAITGYTELIRMDLPGDSSAQDDVLAILASTERGSRLTRQLLAFGRRQVLHPVQLDVNKVLRDMEGVLRPLAGADVTMRLELCHTAALVVADRAQLEQVVVNLVANARDAMAHGGELSIETSIVAVGREGLGPNGPNGSSEPGDYVRIAVRDTGVGMDADVQSRLFEPFFTTKPRGTSTGMALAASYGIVKQSGGFMTVESAPDVGTTVRTFLPFQWQPEAGVVAHQAQDVSSTTRGDETILIVDDDAGVRGSTKAVLERLGYTVLDTSLPSEALHLLAERDGSIAVVVTDIMLPEMSGVQLAAKIRAAHPSVAVIQMSGYAGDAASASAEERISYLQKPFTIDTLARAVRGALAAR